MKKLNVMRLIRLTALSLLLTSCAVTPPDVPVFEHLPQRMATDAKTGHLILKASPTCYKVLKEPECGHGTYIVSGREIYVGEQFFSATWIVDEKTEEPIRLPLKSDKSPLNNKPWSQLRKESIYAPAVETYAPLTAYIINSCKKMNCNDEVTRFKIKVDKLSELPR